MGAAWVSLVSDDPRAAYALRVESVKNGVSRTVKNVCTDWLEDDLNRDVAADPTDLLVAANALHSPRGVRPPRPRSTAWEFLSTLTPSSRRSYGDSIASRAWGG